MAPVSPFPAFKLGEKVDDPLAMYLSDVYTLTGDLAGVPCMSVPCGHSPEGLPVGLQIFAQHFDEVDDVPHRVSIRAGDKSLTHRVRCCRNPNQVSRLCSIGSS